MNKARAISLELLENGKIGVSFPYNEELISGVRSLTDRKWNPELRRWEVAIRHFMELLNIFHLRQSEADRSIVRAYQMYRIRHGRAKITAGNIGAVLSGTTLPLERIDRATSFHLPGYKFMPQYKKGHWDGMRRLFSIAERTFPSGLAPRVERLVRKAGIDCDTVWPEEPDTYMLKFHSGKGDSSAGSAKQKKSRKPASRPEPASITPLRDYQQECVDSALSLRRGIIEIATGGGKTLIAAHLIRRIARPALFIVHTRDLMYQTIAVLERELGIPIGRAGDGKIDVQPVTVATVQTCARVMDIKLERSPDDDESLEKDRPAGARMAEDLRQLIKTTPVVFFDECHHLPADTAYGLAMEMEGALWRYGLSATPYRADRQDLLMEAALGSKIYTARASHLIDLGYLVPPIIRFLPVPPLTVGGSKMTYQEIYSRYIIENIHRNKIVVESASELASSGKSVLTLVNHVRHGELLKDMLGDVPFLQGADPVEDRRKVFGALDTKEAMIVIATTLADEGLDVPSLDSLVLAGGGRSETRALQRVGRALRIVSGKENATVIDFMDNAPFLREHATNRLELFRAEPRFTVEY